MINFKNFIEAYAFDLDKVLKIHQKEFSETAEAINSIEVAEMTRAISDPSVNNFFLRGLMVMLAHNFSPDNPGPYANALQGVYKKPILDNLIKLDRLTKDNLEKIKKAKIKHLEDIGHPRSDFTDVVLMQAVAGITLNAENVSSMNTFHFNNSTKETEMNLVMICLPHQYDQEDIIFLNSIIYHETRHAYDAYFEGKKRYYDGVDINAEEYLSSYIEAKAFTSQITDLVFNFINHYGKSATHAKNKIKRYLEREHAVTSHLHGIGDEMIKLFVLLINEVIKRPDALKQRKDLLDRELIEDMKNIPFVKTIDNEEKHFEKTMNKLEQLFMKLYETVISPKRIFKKYMKRKNIPIIQN